MTPCEITYSSRTLGPKHFNDINADELMKMSFDLITRFGNSFKLTTGGI